MTKKKTDSLLRGPWGSHELKELKRMFSWMPTAGVAKELGRPLEAVKKRASRLGLRKSNRYMKSLGRAVIILLAVCLLQGTARADAGLDLAKWSATTFGSDDLIGLRMEKLGRRTGIGPEILWQDGFNQDDIARWSFGAFAHYDLLQEQTLQILSVQVPTTVYVGARLGAVYNGENADSDANVRHWDAQAGLVFGTTFGDDANRIGFELWGAATSQMWSEFSDFDPEAGVVVTVSHQW